MKAMVVHANTQDRKETTTSPAKNKETFSASIN